MFYDPICGRKLSAGGASPTAEYKKRKYYFCSEGCRHAFESETEKLKMGELAKAGALMSQGKVRWGLA